MDLELEQAELAAMRVQWSRLPNGSVREVDGLHVFSAPGPPWLRQVCGLGFPGGCGDVPRAVAVAPQAALTVVDGAVPDEHLTSHGYRPRVRLLRLAAVPVRRDVAARVEVVGPEAAAVVTDVSTRGFGLDLPQWWAAPLGAPGWTQVLGYDGGDAVATGAMHVHEGLGWFGATATVPHAQRRGWHAALLAVRLARAADAAVARVAVKVEPATASHRNLLSAGFVEAYGMTQWTHEGAPAR